MNKDVESATLVDRVVMTRSSRKPHNDFRGYVCELKSKHPKLPGHIVILDRLKGCDWIDADERWIVTHINGDDCGCHVAVGSLASARSIMKHVANGGDDVDIGQHSSPERLGSSSPKGKTWNK